MDPTKPDQAAVDTSTLPKSQQASSRAVDRAMNALPDAPSRVDSPMVPSCEDLVPQIGDQHDTPMTDAPGTPTVQTHASENSKQRREDAVKTCSAPEAAVPIPYIHDQYLADTTTGPLAAVLVPNNIASPHPQTSEALPLPLLQRYEPHISNPPIAHAPSQANINPIPPTLQPPPKLQPLNPQPPLNPKKRPHSPATPHPRLRSQPHSFPSSPHLPHSTPITQISEWKAAHARLPSLEALAQQVPTLQATLKKTQEALAEAEQEVREQRLRVRKADSDWKRMEEMAMRAEEMQGLVDEEVERRGVVLERLGVVERERDGVVERLGVVEKERGVLERELAAERGVRKGVEDRIGELKRAGEDEVGRLKRAHAERWKAARENQKAMDSRNLELWNRARAGSFAKHQELVKRLGAAAVERKALRESCENEKTTMEEAFASLKQSYKAKIECLEKKHLTAVCKFEESKQKLEVAEQDAAHKSGRCTWLDARLRLKEKQATTASDRFQTELKALSNTLRETRNSLTEMTRATENASMDHKAAITQWQALLHDRDITITKLQGKLSTVSQEQRYINVRRSIIGIAVVHLQIIVDDFKSLGLSTASQEFALRFIRDLTLSLGDNWERLVYFGREKWQKLIAAFPDFTGFLGAQIDPDYELCGDVQWARAPSSCARSGLDVVGQDVDMLEEHAVTAASQEADGVREASTHSGPGPIVVCDVAISNGHTADLASPERINEVRDYCNQAESSLDCNNVISTRSIHGHLHQDKQAAVLDNDSVLEAQLHHSRPQSIIMREDDMADAQTGCPISPCQHTLLNETSSDVINSSTANRPDNDNITSEALNNAPAIVLERAAGDANIDMMRRLSSSNTHINALKQSAEALIGTAGDSEDNCLLARQYRRDMQVVDTIAEPEASRAPAEDNEVQMHMHMHEATNRATGDSAASCIDIIESVSHYGTPSILQPEVHCKRRIESSLSLAPYQALPSVGEIRDFKFDVAREMEQKQLWASGVGGPAISPLMQTERPQMDQSGRPPWDSTQELEDFNLAAEDLDRGVDCEASISHQNETPRQPACPVEDSLMNIPRSEISDLSPDIMTEDKNGLLSPTHEAHETSAAQKPTMITTLTHDASSSYGDHHNTALVDHAQVHQCGESELDGAGLGNDWTARISASRNRQEQQCGD